VKASVGGASVTLLVEVTSKQAYQAVQNAFIDKNTKIAYSQAKRMKKNYRDCSSFVSRCYWDSSMRRKIFAIGGSEGKHWALPAADQAKWLKKHGKCVSEGPCSIERIRPGDTLYFETDYAGKDKSQWRYIDHAAIYVGNGYVMDTGGRGGKGTVGFRWCKFSAKDKSIKLIGRPCP
jgi:cell wall-associated NlpC family hydrolase